MFLIWFTSGIAVSYMRSLNTGLENLGTIKPMVSGEVNVPSGGTIDPTNLCSMWLAPGVYFIEGTAKFNLPKPTSIDPYIKSTDGKYTIGNTVLTLPAGFQWIKNAGILKVEETSKQIVLAVQQTCSSTISCAANIVVMQIRLYGI